MRTLADQALEALRAISGPANDQAKPTNVAQPQPAPLSPAAGVPACGDPECAGCYEVGPNQRIHPRKVGQAWLEWLEQWKPNSKDKRQ